MRQRALKRKTDFQDRKNIGDNLENRVEQKLSQHGIKMDRLNIDCLEETHRETISYLHDSTSKFVKLLPDWCCTIPHKYSFFLECKQSIIDSKSYSFALAEFNTQRKLVDIFGIRILCVFSDLTGTLTAQWLDQINDYEVYDNYKLKNVNGSKKGFVLIRKNSLQLFSRILYQL